jgi:hypothetical protein
MRSSLVPDVHPCVRQCADVFDDLVTEREGLLVEIGVKERDGQP